MKGLGILGKLLLRLALPMTLIIASILTMGILSSNAMKDLSESFKNDSYTSIDLVLNADRDFFQATTGFHSALNEKPGTAAFAEAVDMFESNISDVTERMNDIQSMANSNQDIATLTDPDTGMSVNKNLGSFFPAFSRWINAARDVISEYENGSTYSEVSESVVVSTGYFNEARDNLDMIGQTLSQYPEFLASAEMQADSRQRVVIYLVVAAVVVFAALFFTAGARGIIKKIIRITEAQEKQASSLKTAAGYLSDSSQQLSEGSSEQAASIEETSATMEETASMVSRNAENTADAMKLASETSRMATDGNQKMNELIASMDALKKSSGEISKIIKVIDDIAFNTNILALNAAVEAARAGDAGLGFAVVADEVRTLAQKSAQAAKDTTDIIEQNIGLSEKGVDLSTGVSIDFKEIMENTKKVNELVSNISSASEEQSRGVTQVTDAIGQMEKVVQENAAAAEETASSSEELKKQALQIEGLVAELERLAKGSRAVSEKIHEDGAGE